MKGVEKMPTVIHNQANITYYYNEAKGNALSNTVETIVLEEYAIKGSIQSLKKTFKPGDYITFVCRIENTGHGLLDRVTIKDNLGNHHLDYVYDTLQLYYNSTPIAAVPFIEEKEMTIYLPFLLSPSDKVILIYQTKVKHDLYETIETITTKQRIQATTSNQTLIVATPPPITTLTKEESVDIQIIKTVDKENVYMGQPLTYTFTLINKGILEVNNSIIEDKLPTGFVIEKIYVTTKDERIDYQQGEYTVDKQTNTLTLPNDKGRRLKIPAASITHAGITKVVVAGYMAI